MQHNAPDDSSITNVFHLHMVDKFEATLEHCLPSQGKCQPNIKDLALKSNAGQSETIIPYEQESFKKYFRACKDALFDLTDAPPWLSLTSSFSLVIEAPNDVQIPGHYKFWLGIWEVSLEVEAPCSSNYLQGVTHSGFVALYLDQKVVLVIAY